MKSTIMIAALFLSSAALAGGSQTGNPIVHSGGVGQAIGPRPLGQQPPYRPTFAPTCAPCARIR